MKISSNPFRIWALSALLLAGIVLSAAQGHADDDGDEDDNNRDAALSSVERGEILPLSVIRKQVTAQYPGDILDIDIVRRHGGLRYRFKILTSDGVLQEVVVNAVDGTVLKVENHD